MKTHNHKPNLLVFSIKSVMFNVPLNGYGEMMGDGVSFTSDYTISDNELLFCLADARMQEVQMLNFFTVCNNNVPCTLEFFINTNGIHEFVPLIQEIYKDNYDNQDTKRVD